MSKKRQSSLVKAMALKFEIIKKVYKILLYMYANTMQIKHQRKERSSRHAS